MNWIEFINIQHHWRLTHVHTWVTLPYCIYALRSICHVMFPSSLKMYSVKSFMQTTNEIILSDVEIAAVKLNSIRSPGRTLIRYEKQIHWHSIFAIIIYWSEWLKCHRLTFTGRGNIRWGAGRQREFSSENFSISRISRCFLCKMEFGLFLFVTHFQVK